MRSIIEFGVPRICMLNKTRLLLGAFPFIAIVIISCASVANRVSIPTIEELPAGYGFFDGTLNLTFLKSPDGCAKLMPTPTLGIWATGTGTLQWRQSDGRIENLHFSSSRVLQLDVPGFGTKPCFPYRDNTFLMLADFRISAETVYVGRILQIAVCTGQGYCPKTQPEEISCELECRLMFLRGDLRRGITVD